MSPSGASGSVIQEPNLDPEILMVMGSLMPVSLPQAATKKALNEKPEVDQRPELSIRTMAVFIFAENLSF